MSIPVKLAALLLLAGLAACSQVEEDRVPWAEFHDEFLSYGNPPIPLLRKEMLGGAYGGDTALLPN